MKKVIILLAVLLVLLANVASAQAYHGPDCYDLSEAHVVGIFVGWYEDPDRVSVRYDTCLGKASKTVYVNDSTQYQGVEEFSDLEPYVLQTGLSVSFYTDEEDDISYARTISVLYRK